MAISFTKEQQAVIDSRNKNILVSASAGSGKTTVMIQRIINLVLDEKNPTPISNFLVVTFTKASASDMKKKLIDAFLEHQDNPFVLEQIDEVETSDISNLHSFCSKLISTYFYEIGIDPSYQVLDETNSRFLQDKAFEKLFETKEKNFDEEYLKLFDIFQKNRKNYALKEMISKFNDFLNANLDAFEWVDGAIQEIYDQNIKTNKCANILNGYVAFEVQELREKILEFSNVCLHQGLDKIYNYFIEVESALGGINAKNSYEVNAKNLFELKIPKAPIVKADVALKPQIEELKKLIKDQIGNFKKNLISDDIEFLKQGLKESKEVVVGLLNLVREFNEIYSSLKKEYNGLDFNDLEKNALKILENDKILESVKRKYKYVFVDEYQDINSVQEKIISLVSGQNNRFMVGDVKQSIYRFRYCDPEIFLKKYNDYGRSNGNDELHKLNCNFRSDKKILKFVDEIFADVMTEKFGGINYKKDSMFIAGEKNLDLDQSVNLCFIDTTKNAKQDIKVEGVYSVKNHKQVETDDDEVAVAEAKYVADKISKLIEEKGKEFSFDQVAVLVASRNAVVEKFIESLVAYGVPVSADEKYDLMQRTHIQEIINFVKYVCNKNDDFLAFKVLKSRLVGLTDDEIAEIRMIDMKSRFFECLNKTEEIENEDLKIKLNEFNARVEKFSRLARLVSLKDFCRMIVDEFDLQQINSASAECGKANLEIDKLFEILPDVTVFDFVLNFGDFSFELESEGASYDAVQLMTIHKSKGIEFKYVFVINTSNDFNFKSTFGSVVFNKDLGVGVDYFDIKNRTQIESIASEGIKLLEKRKLVEEKQRVLYVALTRAIERLYVVCSKPIAKVCEEIKPRKTCFCDWFDPILFKELNGNHSDIINFERFDLSELCEKQKTEKRQIHFKDKKVKEPDWFEYGYNNSVKTPLKSSVSRILKDKESGLSIKYVGKSSAERGTIYHKCFEKINFTSDVPIQTQIFNSFESLTEDEKQIVDIEVLYKTLSLPLFEEISKAKTVLTEREFYAKLNKEYEIENADDSFILQGVIDLVAVFDDGLIVLDYKTGSFNQEKLKDYEFQLNTYSKVAEKSFGSKILKKVICFVDEQKIIEI